jgi:hypothetical protein
MWHIFPTPVSFLKVFSLDTGFWWGDRRERDNLQDLCVGGRIILKWSYNMDDGGRTGLLWLRIGTVGELI